MGRQHPPTTPGYAPTANIYLFKVNHGKNRKRFEICSNLTIKTPERRNWRRSGVFIVNFEHNSHIFHVFSLLLATQVSAWIFWHFCRSCKCCDFMSFKSSCSATFRKIFSMMNTLCKMFVVHFHNISSLQTFLSDKSNYLGKTV